MGRGHRCSDPERETRMEREVEDMDSEDVGLGAASALAGQVTPVQVTAPRLTPYQSAIEKPVESAGPRLGDEPDWR